MNRPRQAAIGIALILLSCCGLTRPAAAEPNSEPETWLRRGAPIRAQIGPDAKWTTGTFDRVRSDSLLFLVGSTHAQRHQVAVGVHAIRSLQVGREAGTKTWTGFAIGFAALGALGAVLTAADPEVDNKAGGAALGLMVFGPLGALLGSFIGSSVHSEHWVAAEIPDPAVHQGRARAERDVIGTGETGGGR